MRPVLLWEAAPALAEKPELRWETQPGFRLDSGGNQDPLVFPLEKRQQRNNAFRIGITLGRTSNNDLAVDSASVSRFHAFFQRDEHSGVWHVVDAESSNGTWCAGVRLQPGRPAPLQDGVEVKVGTVELRFLTPKAFLERLRSAGRR